MRIVVASFALLAVPALAQEGVPAPPPPAAVAPAAPPAPAPPPVVVPQPSEAQILLLGRWLGTGYEHGVAAAGSSGVPDNADLVAAVLDRARALHGGRLADGDFLSIWAMRPAPYDPLPEFAAAVTADRLGQWLASLTPPYAGYDGLKKGLSAYRAIAKTGGWEAVPAGPDMGLGAKGPRVAALRARLRVEDKDVATVGGYDAALGAAVQRAQRRYGLNPTGVANVPTLAALNVPVGARIDAIVANLERWRWLPRELPTHRVQVNIAAAVLTVFEGDKPVESMRAVTGRPGAETPMLASKIHSIVVNPPWNVPQGIAARELLPKGPAYLKAHGFKQMTSADGATKWLQQAAGPQSALGRLKFDFANPFAVYLHDTPTRGTFATYDRLDSHGCVRLEKPVDLAELMLKDDPKWGVPGAIPAAIATDKTQRVPLTDQVAVYLLYWTAFASADGRMNFRADPYGWDKLLAAKVAAAAERAKAQVPPAPTPVIAGTR